jgi:protoporphyrinogen oxidase
VFNTKRQEVLDFFWSFFDKENEFVLSDRNSVVAMPRGEWVPYPIENHVYKLDEAIVQSFIVDLLLLHDQQGKSEPKNFEEFLSNRFGKTLYELYFRPYNEKVWRRDLSKVPMSWLEGKLPMPTVEEMLYNNIKQVEEKQFVHSRFYYAKQDGSQFLVNRLSEGLNILCNHAIKSLEQQSDGQWKVDGELFDKVVFCGNIKCLPSILPILTEAEKSQIEALESHGTTTVRCEVDENPYSWIYLPSREYDSHRIICTGNFSPTNRANGKMSATIEFTDYKSESEIVEQLKRLPLHPKYLAHHYEKYTYPIQDMETRKNIQLMRQRLASKHLYLCGRFAEWEYYNMDVAMASAISLSKEL